MNLGYYCCWASLFPIYSLHINIGHILNNILVGGAIVVVADFVFAASLLATDVTVTAGIALLLIANNCDS